MSRDCPAPGKQQLQNGCTKNQAELYTEDFSNYPNDLYRIAGISSEAYESLSLTYPFLSPFTLDHDSYRFISIGDVIACFPNEQQLIRILQQWDIGDEFNPKVSVAYFVEYSLARMRKWMKTCSRRSSYIMDSVWLQNPINEMKFRNAGEREIVEYCKAIASVFAGYHQICVYFKGRNVDDTIQFASRVKGELWRIRVAEHISKTPIGIVNEWSGMEGVLHFFTYRARIEEIILSLGIMTTYEYEVDGHNWRELYADIERRLERTGFLASSETQ
ncbi:hypothetical protein [Paenibacillus sp. MBLB4367]|uniref:hypothetical protein n=1 Tax=Paenibacillus sp. MBLB4367 TaxID=3384767 RepID=UPI0039080F59